MKLLIKITGILTGSLIIFVIALSSNSQWFDKFILHMPNPYRYGDLFLFSDMPGYKIRVDTNKIRPPVRVTNNHIALTVIGDSHMLHFDSLSFNAGEYHFIHWNDIPAPIPPPDSQKTNILVIETTERYCRERLIKDKLIYPGAKKRVTAEEAQIKLSAEDNLQFVLTNMDWAIPFKELKTFISLKLFDKFDSRVAKPDGSGRLFLEETIHSEKSSSCYNPVSDSEIIELVDTLNIIYENVKGMGFDRVYLSIIPNSASIYHHSDLPYNNIIERIQGHPNLKMPYIDAYQTFKNQSNSVFYCNDSHCNNLGRTLWLAKVNSALSIPKR